MGRHPTNLAAPSKANTRPRRARRLGWDCLETRQLLATLLPLRNVEVPEKLGLVVPLFGGTETDQSFTARSSNPEIRAEIVRGQFLTFSVTHVSSGKDDPSFSGDITFQLFQELTPVTYERITRLVEQGFYSGKVFHRVANGFPGPDDFIVQGGSVDNNGSGEVQQPGFPFQDEFVQSLVFNGSYQLAMANAGDDTNSSQFFITTGQPRSLDFQHTIFGQLVQGQQLVDLMTQVARGGAQGTTPTSPITINSATLTRDNGNGVLIIDATQAEDGDKATITVTANDGKSTVTRNFRVEVDANPVNERPFISQTVPNQVVGEDQVAVFQINAARPNVGDVLTYRVAGGTSGTTFLPVQNATATVDDNGIVTVTPNPGFTGVINLVVGVRNQTIHPPATSLDGADNFDTQTLTLTVTDGGRVNLQPIAVDGESRAVIDTPSPVTLEGVTANPQNNQTLRYQIVSGPRHGRIAQFNPTRGTFTYIPNSGFRGEDSVTFRVTDSGFPGPSLTSANAVHRIFVGGAPIVTTPGSVRIFEIDAVGETKRKVLVVTPPPRTDSVPNTVRIRRGRTNDEGDRFVDVIVNGVTTDVGETLLVSELKKIVVYGSKASDTITIDPGLRVPATLDGGAGGVNKLNAGGGRTRGHVWYGYNDYRGGPNYDFVAGMLGHFRVQPSAGGDLIFVGEPRRASTLVRPGLKPGGQFYTFRNGKLVPTHPKTSRQQVLRARRAARPSAKIDPARIDPSQLDEALLGLDGPIDIDDTIDTPLDDVTGPNDTLD